MVQRIIILFFLVVCALCATEQSKTKDYTKDPFLKKLGFTQKEYDAFALYMDAISKDRSMGVIQLASNYHNLEWLLKESKTNKKLQRAGIRPSSVEVLKTREARALIAEITKKVSNKDFSVEAMFVRYDDRGNLTYGDISVRGPVQVTGYARKLITDNPETGVTISSFEYDCYQHFKDNIATISSYMRYSCES
jgi:hypothetical protein